MKNVKSELKEVSFCYLRNKLEILNEYFMTVSTNEYEEYTTCKFTILYR